MKKFIWCSPHTPTQEQVESLQKQGELLFLKEIAPALMEQLENCPKTRMAMRALAFEIEKIADEATIVQLGGSPAFLYVAGATINGALSKRIIFADSERVSEDHPQPDGSVKKISVFRHLGWI